MSEGSSPDVPLIYRLVRDRTGQSETIGVVLLLGIAVVGTAGIVAFGSVALNSTREASQLQRTEHTMTLFDSRTAMVALGEADVQQVDLAGGGNGNYSVQPNAGWMKIVHYNHSGEDNAEVVYNATLGAMVYENGDTEIAYQGGGVWRKDGSAQRMVSPPEFHYRKSTLTLPVIKVRGDGSASGEATATVTSTQQANRIFPDGTNDSAKDGPAHFGAPYNDTDGDGDEEPTRPYTNPVQNGSVWVYVHSEYYEAWGEYFETRSEGTVKVWDGNRTVGIELISKGKVGFFQMPPDGGSVQVRGTGKGHVTNDFNVTLSPDDDDNAKFSNLQWSLYVSQGNRQWEAHIRNAKKPCKNGENWAEVLVYFDRNDSDGYFQGWHHEAGDDATDPSPAHVVCKDYDGDGTDENVIEFNLTSDVEMDYEAISGGRLNEFSTSGEALREDVKWDDHAGPVAWEPTWWDPSYTNGSDTAEMNRTTNHYFALFADPFQLTVNDKSGDRVSEADSHGELYYSGGGKIYITYLHVTENTVEIEL